MAHKPQSLAWVLLTLREALWAPLGVFLLYLIALHLQLFKMFPPLDIPTHFMGGIAITFFFRAAIRRSQKLVGEIPFPVQVLFAFTCTATTTIFWEFYEYLSDFFFQTQMVRGGVDTMVDFLAGLLGALALSVVHRQR